MAYHHHHLVVDTGGSGGLGIGIDSGNHFVINTGSGWVSTSTDDGHSHKFNLGANSSFSTIFIADGALKTLNRSGQWTTDEFEDHHHYINVGIDGGGGY